MGNNENKLIRQICAIYSRGIDEVKCTSCFVILFLLNNQLYFFKEANESNPLFVY